MVGKKEELHFSTAVFFPSCFAFNKTSMLLKKSPYQISQAL